MYDAGEHADQTTALSTAVHAVLLFVYRYSVCVCVPYTHLLDLMYAGQVISNERNLMRLRQQIALIASDRLSECIND